MENKKGNEILQTLVIIAVIGALAITIAILISNKLRDTTNTGLKNVGDGIVSGVDSASSGRNELIK